MKKLLTLLSLFFICIILWNCTPKAEPEEITGMTTYEDVALKFSIKHPQNWILQTIPGSRLIVYSSKGAKDRFIQYDAEGKAGARIDIYAKKLDTGKTMEDFMASTKLFDKKIYSKPIKVKLDGVDAVKQTYSFELTDGNWMVKFTMRQRMVNMLLLSFLKLSAEHCKDTKNTLMKYLHR